MRVFSGWGGTAEHLSPLLSSDVDRSAVVLLAILPAILVVGAVGVLVFAFWYALRS